MKLYKLLPGKGWTEESDIPQNLEDENIHTLLLYQGDICGEEHKIENDTNFVINFKLKDHEVEFTPDEQPVTGILCTLSVTNCHGLDDEFEVKLQCQTLQGHLEFTIKPLLAAFDDDEYPPENPEDFITKILEAHISMSSPEEEETNITDISPVEVQLKNLLQSFKITRNALSSPPITSIPFKNLHVSQVMRPVCKPQICKYKSLMDKNNFQWDSTIFDVVKHKTYEGHYEIINGNSRFLAAVEQKVAKKDYPKEIKCRIYQTSQKFGTLAVGLNIQKSKKEHPLNIIERASFSFLKKYFFKTMLMLQASLVRKLLTSQNISRQLAAKEDIQKLHDYLFKNEAMFKSFPPLVGLRDEFFEMCSNVSVKFANNEICYSSKKEDKCPLKYKVNGVNTVTDIFLQKVLHCFRQNSKTAVSILSKLSSTYGITDAIKDFEEASLDLNQALLTSGITFEKTLQEAIDLFELPPGTTAEQVHFLLSSRKIQKQLTRKKGFKEEDAKENIRIFLEKVNIIETDHYPNITDIVDFKFVVCFEPFDWATFVLPKNCLVFDLCNSNDAHLGQDILPAWNIKIITKSLEVPVDGKLPLVTTQLRMFYLTDKSEKDGEYARNILQEKATAKMIRLGTVMTVEDLILLFKFVDKDASCLYYHPPLEWLELLANATVNAIESCSSVTIVTDSRNITSKFREKLGQKLTYQWQKLAETVTEPPKPRKKRSLSSSLPSTSNSTTPTNSKRKKRSSAKSAETTPHPISPANAQNQ